MFRTKAQRRNRWNAACLDYSTRIVNFQIALASMPTTIKSSDPTGRALLLALESSRLFLADVRKRLLTEAQKLGIDNPDLPDPAWPDPNVIPFQRATGAA